MSKLFKWEIIIRRRVVDDKILIIHRISNNSNKYIIHSCQKLWTSNYIVLLDWIRKKKDFWIQNIPEKLLMSTLSINIIDFLVLLVANDVTYWIDLHR